MPATLRVHDRKEKVTPVKLKVKDRPVRCPVEFQSIGIPSDSRRLTIVVSEFGDERRRLLLYDSDYSIAENESITQVMSQYFSTDSLETPAALYFDHQTEGLFDEFEDEYINCLVRFLEQFGFFPVEDEILPGKTIQLSRS